jgi:predicted DNA-binding transcriptional regulator AlpA
MGFNTKEASRRIGIGTAALYSYVNRGVVPSPRRLTGSQVFVWTEADCQAVREALEHRRQPSAV